MSARRYSHRDQPLVDRLRRMMEGADDERRAYSSVWEAADRIEALEAELVGLREQFVRWSNTEGTTMRPCPSCAGTGLACWFFFRYLRCDRRAGGTR